MWGCVFDVDIPDVSNESNICTLNYWPVKIQAVDFLQMSRSDYSTAQHYTPEAGNTCLCPSRCRRFVIRVWRMPLLDVGKLWEACNLRSEHRTVPPLMRCGLKRLDWELVCPLVRLFRKKKIAKSDYFSFSCLCIHPSSWNNSVPSGRIVIKLDIWVPNVYWTVHHCNSWGIKNQLDVTCCLYFTYICWTCFEH